MDSVDVGEGPGCVCEADDFLYGIDGAHRIRSVADGDQLGVAADLSRRVGQVERAVFVVNLSPAHGDAAIFGHRNPGRNVGIVIETGDQDFVAGLSSRPIAREMAKVRVVMFGPKTTSSAPQCRKSAIAARARRSSHRYGGWWRRLRRCWRCRGSNKRRWHRSRVAALGFRRGRRGRRRDGR